MTRFILTLTTTFWLASLAQAIAEESEPASRDNASSPNDVDSNIAPNPATDENSVNTATVAKSTETKASQTPKRFSESEIAKLIAELDSNVYTVREAATVQLAKIGRPALPYVAKAVESKELEVSVRTLGIIAGWYATDDKSMQDDIEDVIDQLLNSKDPSVVSRTSSFVGSHYRIREGRALKRIEELGGIVTYSTNTYINPVQPNMPRTGQYVSYILLGRQWKGGDEGVKYIKRLSQLPMIYLTSSARFSPISKVARDELVRALPMMKLQERGMACLGIGATPSAGGCQITIVKPGSAAHQGGLQQYDVITSFGGKEVPTFDRLIELIAEKDPGEKVKVKVRRGSIEVDAEVELGEWGRDSIPNPQGPIPRR